MAGRNKSTSKYLNERVQRHPDGSIERWRDIPDYWGLYRISDRGRVKSLTRTFLKRNRWGGVMQTTIKGRLMKLATNREGRLSVGLVGRDGGRQVPTFVHRLVLLAFVGPCPLGMEACHFPDRDPANNRLENLRWDTHINNKADQLVHGTHTRGERNGSAKLTSRQVVSIRRLYAVGWTRRQLANRYGVTPEMITRIADRRAWKHL